MDTIGKGDKSKMKSRIITKIFIGCTLGIISIVGLIEGGVNAPGILPLMFMIVWSIGEVYAIPYYLELIEHKLTTILKISIISYLAIGKNVLITIILICYLFFVIIFGWIAGWIMLVADIRNL